MTSKSALVEWCTRQLDVIGSILSNALNDENLDRFVPRVHIMSSKFSFFVNSFTKHCNRTDDEVIHVIRLLTLLATRVKDFIDTAKEKHENDQYVVNQLNLFLNSFVEGCERVAGDKFELYFWNIFNKKSALTNIPSNNPYIIHCI